MRHHQSRKLAVTAASLMMSRVAIAAGAFPMQAMLRRAYVLRSYLDASISKRSSSLRSLRRKLLVPEHGVVIEVDFGVECDQPFVLR